MGSKEDSLGTLDVSGEGRVAVRPDTATVRLAIHREAKTAGDAVTENAAAAEAVLAAIRGLEGVELGDDAITTEGLGVGPVYQYNEATKSNELVGYRASNQIVVTVAVDDVGAIYDAGVGAGAHHASGISFAVADERPYRQRALEAAVAAAQSDACVVAEALGIRLRGPAQIEVDPGGGILVRGAEMAQARVSTPVEAGSLTISARVRVTYHYRH